MSNPSVRKYLDISTGHITKEDSERLAADALARRPFHPIVEESWYGWWVYAPTELKKEWAPEVSARGYSKEFIGVLAYARKHRCTWIKLDCDAPVVPGLPVFDW